MEPSVTMSGECEVGVWMPTEPCTCGCTLRSAGRGSAAMHARMHACVRSCTHSQGVQAQDVTACKAGTQDYYGPRHWHACTWPYSACIHH